MKRWARRAAVAAAAAAVLCGAGYLALRALFPAEKLKGMALARLQAALGREVRVASAAMGLGSLDLRGLEVSQSPDFKAGTLCSVKSASVSFRLWPLLTKRRLEIGQVKAEGWKLSASAAPPPAPAAPAKKRKGKAAPAPAPEAPAAVAKSSSSFSLDISRLVLSGGELEYGDKARGFSVRLRDIGLKASEVRPGRPFPFSLSLAFETGDGAAKIKGTLDAKGRLDPAGGSVEVKPLEARIGDAEASVEGRVSGLDSPEADLDFSLSPLSRKALKPAPGLASKLPEGLVTPALKGGLRFKQSAGALEVQELFVSGGDLSAALSAENRGNVWKLHASHLGWKGAKAVLSGTVTLPSGKQKEPGLDLRLVTEKIPLAVVGGLVPAVDQYKAKGVVKADLSVKGTPSAPSLSGDVELDGIGATAKGQVFSGLTGKVSFTDRTVKGGLKGKFNEGDMDLQLDARDYNGPKPDYRLNGSLSVLDLAKIPEPGKPADSEPGEPEPSEPKPGKEAKAPKGPERPISTSGSFTVGSIRHPKFEAADAKLAWDLRGLASDLSHLNGSASFHLNKGRLQELKVLGETKPLVKLGLMPVMALQKAAGLVKIPLFPSFDKVTFESITGDYTFADGVMKIKESHIDSSAGYAVMQGSADLGREVLDLHVATRLAIKEIGGPVGFKVVGSFKDPRVRLDPAAILKQPAVEQAVDKAVEQGKELGEKLLKGLFKR